MDDFTGKTLKNQFFLRRLVGQGGMADVYEAWDRQRSVRLAVKILRPDLAYNAKVIHEFSKEIELIQRLSHPNIVRFYEQGEEPPDLFYFIMDFIDGQNLREMIADQGKPFNLEEISAVLKPVCTALQFAHQSGIYHCDIKPANILIDNRNQVLLSDFGIARLANETTQSGTPPYMAPEQFNHDPIGSYTDVYGLGMVLFELLCQQLPYRGETSSGGTTRDRIRWEVENMVLPSMRQFNSQISTEVERVVAKALSKSPEERYQDVISLYNEFERSRSSTIERRPIFKDLPTITIEKNEPSPKAPGTLPPSLIPRRRPVRTTKPPPSVSAVVHGPRLVCLEGEYRGRIFQIPAEGLTIGRASENRLRLSESSVSRYHAIIRKVRNMYILEDRGSTLGTRLNSMILRKQNFALHSKDIIRIGYEQVFQFL